MGRKYEKESAKNLQTTKVKDEMAKKIKV